MSTVSSRARSRPIFRFRRRPSTSWLIPMDQDLVQALTAAARTNLTFLVTERGAPFTAAGFGNWFRDRCNEAGLPQCSAHGLRKLAATRMANAGCSTDQIKAITGHKSLSEVARYTKAADQARLARQAMSMVREDREQKLSSNRKNFEVASPAGLEPATCGLEIRCCYPAELRGRDRKLLPQERLHLPAPQRAAPTGPPVDRRQGPPR